MSDAGSAPGTNRPDAQRPKLSADCRDGGHGFCSGKRFVTVGHRGQPLYGRCQCECHRAVEPEASGAAVAVLGDTEP